MPTPELFHRRAVLGMLGAGVALPRLALAGQLDPAAYTGFLDAPRPSLTLSNATVLTHDGRVLEGSGVRVENGRIVELGPSVKGGQDLGGDWLAPGIVDAGCTLGLFEIGAEAATKDDHDGPSVAPAARAVDGFHPRSMTLPVARVEGITHAVIHPQLQGLVPGRAALVRTAGGTLDSAVRREALALVVCFGKAGTGGKNGVDTRIGVARALRELMEKAPEPRPLQGRAAASGTWRENSRQSKAPETEHDRVLLHAKERRLKVLAAASRADDIERALDWFADQKLDGLILGGAEAWMVADQLADAGVGVLLGPVTTQPDRFDHLHARYENAALLHEAGVPFAFRSGGNHFARQLRIHAGIATAHGLPYEAAVHGLTASAGALLGVPGLGRLEPGAPGTFFRATGDPLQPRSRVVQVWMAGRRTRMETRQTRLRDQFQALPPR
jgi:imidazolonepropionase-like amidohydrolase